MRRQKVWGAFGAVTAALLVAGAGVAVADPAGNGYTVRDGAGVIGVSQGAEGTAITVTVPDPLTICNKPSVYKTEMSWTELAQYWRNLFDDVGVPGDSFDAGLEQVYPPGGLEIMKVMAPETGAMLDDDEWVPSPHTVTVDLAEDGRHYATTFCVTLVEVVQNDVVVDYVLADGVDFYMSEIGGGTAPGGPAGPGANSGSAEFFDGVFGSLGRIFG